MAYNTVIYEKSDRIGTITLNRPGSMNSLSTELLKELDHVLTEIDNDDEVKVVILAGSDKYFAAGADITEIGQIKNPKDAHRFLKMAQSVFNHIEDLEKPVIAAVGGLALGGGCEPHARLRPADCGGERDIWSAGNQNWSNSRRRRDAAPAQNSGRHKGERAFVHWRFHGCAGSMADRPD